MNATLPLSVIIPTRGDRPLFSRLLNLNIQRCNADDIIVIDHAPQSSENDLLQRLQIGVEQAKHKHVAILEDDDIYHPGWWNFIYGLTAQYPDNLCYGIKKFAYYHLRHHALHIWEKTNTCALFASAFKTHWLGQALENIMPEHSKAIAIDENLWRSAPLGTRLLHACDVAPIGLKHGTGLLGGKGHGKELYQTTDLCNSWLKKQLAHDPEGLAVVIEIAEELKKLKA